LPAFGPDAKNLPHPRGPERTENAPKEKTMKSVDEILDFAIGREQAAHDFYMDLAKKMERPGMKQIFTQFAGEELGHKAKLQSIKEGKRLLPSKEKVMNLKIAEYTVDVDPNQELDYQKALILAMKREKTSFRLYSDLAAALDDADLRNTFLALAQEEAKHKLRFEVEYDDVILVEN
jgi:rubrerythrin